LISIQFVMRLRYPSRNTFEPERPLWSIRLCGELICLIFARILLVCHLDGNG
jgi:hypothetical protein